MEIVYFKTNNCAGTDRHNYLTEIGWEAMDWIHLAQEKVLLQPLMNTAMKLRVS
jgi:hypothetical protein